MGRPERHDADYFPFYVKDGKTLFILESKYGLQGIGFFTNLMRFLTRQTDHHICIKEESDRLYFFAQMRCPEDIGTDMIGLMAKTSKVDAKLWSESRVIVSKDLLDSLKDAYKNRNNAIIEIDQIRLSYQLNPISYQDNPITSPDKPQRKLKERKLKERNAHVNDFEKFWNAYPKKKSKGQAEKAWLRIKPDEQLLATITAKIEQAMKSDDWQKDDGKFIPHPATWLNAKGWEDEYGPPLCGSKPPGKSGGDPFAVCPSCKREVLRCDLTASGCLKCERPSATGRMAIDKIMAEVCNG